MDEVKTMRKIALLTCLALAMPALTTAALASHSHNRKHWGHIRAPAPAAESLTTVGTPDCHVQGRFSRIAHHCPPDAIAAAPR
ncbi:MAG: hypothetical protein ACLQDM_22350 [Bradyrhizobium sp.]